MTRTEIAKALRTFTGSGTITVSELAQFVGEKNRHRVKQKYLQEDPDSAAPVLLAIDGKRYLIQDVATRLHEHMR